MDGLGQDRGSSTPEDGTGRSSDRSQIQRVLRDIDRLAGQLRKLRGASAEKRANETQIRALEASLRSKWEEIRTLRAKRSLPPGPMLPPTSRPRLSRGPADR